MVCLICARGTLSRSLLGSSFSFFPNSNHINSWPSSLLTGSTKRPLIWQPTTNSPIYYIKLAPSAAKSQIQAAQGLGYVNSPSSNLHRPFFSVPFKANGRPSSVYTLSSTSPSSSQSSSSSSASSSWVTTSRPVKIKPTNSPIKWLPGKFTFDGKPPSTVSLFKSSLFQSLFGKLMKSPEKKKSTTTMVKPSEKHKSSSKRRNSKFDLFMWNRDSSSKDT